MDQLTENEIKVMGEYYEILEKEAEEMEKATNKVLSDVQKLISENEYNEVWEYL